MLSIMKKVAARLQEGKPVEHEHLAKIIDFFQNFADTCHHGKEENILFPELLKNTANIHAINELLGEHKSGRDFIRGIAESFEHYEAGNSDAFHIAVNARGYTNLLTEHIKKETPLFLAADKQLPLAVQNEMQERFAELERNVIGPGKHEEYHGWLQELKEIYRA